MLAFARLLASGFLLLVACVGCANVKQPTASYKSMSVGEVTSKGFVMNVDVDLNNPNPVALPLTDADYTLALGGLKVIDGAKIKPAGSLPANGAATVTVPAALTFENLLAAEEAIRKGGGSVRYALDTGFNVDTGVPVLGVRRVPFSYEGTLNVRELLQKNWSTILTSPAAKELASKVLGGILNRF